MAEFRLDFDTPQQAGAVCGGREEHLRAFEKAFNVTVVARGTSVKICGDGPGVGRCRTVLGELSEAARLGREIRRDDIAYAIRAVARRREGEMQAFLSDRIRVPSKKIFVTPRTEGQKAYVDAIRGNDIVFGIGPAGTGKTYLAMAMAVEALVDERAGRIILTRPAVEAGESLGFLPGDLHEKITPYLRPLYDALYDMMDPAQVARHIERGLIEVAPLAYMRGRTLNDSFIILDEAQNSTAEQMKMFLTRLGPGSKAAVTGDVTQIDLEDPQASGLIRIQQILKGLDGIAFCYFTERDVVRHRLVKDIILAFDRGATPPSEEGER